MIVASSTTTLLHVVERRQVVHDVEQDLLEDRAQAARAGLARRAPCLAIALQRVVADLELDAFHRGTVFWYCLISAFFGSARIWISAASSSSSSVATTGRRPTNSGNQAVLDEVLGLDARAAASFSVLAVVRRAAHFGAEADAGLGRCGCG